MTTPTLRLRVTPRIPVSVSGDDGITLRVDGSTLVAGQDWSVFALNTPPDTQPLSLLVYDEAIGTLQRVPVSSISGSVSAQQLEGKLSRDGSQAMLGDLSFDVGHTVFLNVDGGANQAVRGSQLTVAIDGVSAGISDKVTGPASAIDGRIARFDGVTGKIIKDGGTDAALVSGSLGGAFASVASAATTDISADGINKVVTGTATITAFTLGANQARFLKLPAGITITNNAAIACQGGANILTRAGDTVWIRSGATANVVEVSNLVRADGASQDIDITARANGKGLFYSATLGKNIYAWASPQNAVIDLRDLMDEVYGIGAWTQRTGVNIGSDIAPALTLGANRLKAAYGYGVISIPPGVWMMKTAIVGDVLSGVSLVGMSVSGGCGIVYSAAGNCLYRTAAGGYSSYKQQHLSILREDGTSGGVAWIDQGDATYQPGQITANDLYITAIGTGRWTSNLYLNGSAKTSGAAGIREIDASNIQMFQSGSGGGFAVLIKNLRQGVINNFGTYSGSGALANNIYIQGDGTINGDTQQCDFTRMAVGGTLQITDSRTIKLDGSCGSFVTNSTATYVNGWLRAGSASGTVDAATSNLTVRI